MPGNNGQNLRKRLIMGGGAVVVAVALYFALRPPPLAVDFGEVTRGALTVTIDEEGETRVHEAYMVSSPVGGRIHRIDHHVGDLLVGGQTIIARIQPSDPAFLDIRSQTEAEAQVHAAQAALNLAEADIQRAVADRDLASADLGRTEKLSKTNTVSKAALDRARADYKRAQANVQTAQASVDVARYQLERANAALIGPDEDGTKECCQIEVRAPVSGRVLRVIQESEAVAPAGTPLVEIGDPSDLEIVADLLSTDAIKVQPGASVLIDEWGGDRILNGRVRRVEPFGFTKVSALGVEEQRVNVVIDFSDPREFWQALGHGYRVEVKIVSWQGDDIVQVPTAALFRERGEWAVFVDEGGEARLAVVTIGHSNDNHAEILAGLEAGARVVLHPGAGLSDGARLTARED